jgi:hypothetical protein
MRSARDRTVDSSAGGRGNRLYAQLSVVDDFLRGSVSENWRKCGKPNCACAALDHPGHGPRFLWTRSAGRPKTTGRQLAAAEVAKLRGELARHAEFAAAVEQIAEVSENICEARPVAAADAPPVPEGEKGPFEALAREKSAEIAKLAAEAARSPADLLGHPFADGFYRERTARLHDTTVPLLSAAN